MSSLWIDLNGSHALGHVNSELDHVEDLSIEHPDEDEVVRPLLRMEPDEEEGSVVLLSPELERLDGLKGVNIVLLGEVDRFRSLQHRLQVEKTQGRWVSSSSARGSRVELEKEWTSSTSPSFDSFLPPVTPADQTKRLTSSLRAICTLSEI